ncbi:Dihydroorotate dehydrogenase, electron transfer subunit, iron-sulfur cluster binding domain [Oceanithermus profundus DSM 14977]|uniref:Dihydroorotate dehydrogenase, electron transfer subunit, iron-sulfur cluster binding domain n=1 Tax=Oceanithermus profundus (strain DSM 14977 / NBRC 100410 / VKM B-2274 / 506) TaxID=670487 RepID=E4U7H3_OCEP5|nr:dihydroorotate dehydrogenase, electron transfer subunit, iron-sulfur cluster binding domain [Oceanithermus profundus]ADR36422.1 Dihydroorotate dehydrogenase, electron transfer subunit, iron-sulfur cluster binding domain [Oceanithermus profundus DSM 14977]
MTPASPELAPRRPRWDDHAVTIVASESLGPHQRLVLAMPTLEARFGPGQFLNLSVPGHVLRRPLAPSRHEGGEVELIVTPFGPGTRDLVALPVGTRLQALAPLGNSFPIPADEAALVGAGAGAAPLAFLAETLLRAGRRVHVFHGAVSNEDRPLVQAVYERLGLEVRYFSEDGSLGRRGYPTEGLAELLAGGAEATVYSVGPFALMRAAARLAIEHGRPGYVSLDVHMACGVGACLSCAVQTTAGQKHACVDGPVFEVREVVW